MQLPDVSRTYATEMEEVLIGKGDYLVGGARSPAFLELDNARHRRPVIFGEVCDTLEGYPASAADMFSGRQNDTEEWAVMWKEIRADGVCIRITKPESAGLVQRIADRTRLPVMVFADTEVLKQIASSVKDTILILGCRDTQQSLDMSSCSYDHVVMATCGGCDPQDICGRMASNGARKIIVNLGDGRMDDGLKTVRSSIAAYRLNGIGGKEDSQHPVVCDVTGSWDSIDDGATARRASMTEATVALSIIKAGADLLVIRGPGAADMARVYGSELAGL